MLYPLRRIGIETASVMVASLVSSGCATGIGHPNLDATLWVQSSVEYRANTTSIYEGAARDLERTLRDTTVSAALEQGERFGSLPPAVILDIDETVLDNIAYQARLILSDQQYDAESWAAWVNEAKAPPVPGVVDFLRTAARLGVTVFYVTNRVAASEAATRANLGALGLPMRDDVDVVLTLGERPEWGSDKTARRAAIAERYRVVMLFGDDLTDFVQPRPNTAAERNALLLRYHDYWGDRWRVLPNPTYGSWERALYGSDSGLSMSERTKRKLDVLDPDT